LRRGRRTDRGGGGVRTPRETSSRTAVLAACGAWEGGCWLIEIGDDVQTAPRVHIIAHDASTFGHLGYTRIARVRIDDRVFLGAGVIVLPGVTIGDDAIVGAGSVVTRDIPPRTVAAGSPARPIMDLDDDPDRVRSSRAVRPFFGTGYTVAGGITPRMRREQRDALADGEGFVV
jgi:maltose O-acetyltransferase